MKKQRYKAGFTLSEVLLTIAILAVLAAVAIPGVLAARRQLKMMELNDTAREIFLAAQNTLTARRAAGTLLPAAGAKEDGTDLYWLDQDGAGYLLPTGAIEAVAAGNHYQIRYNPKTATVLEVYYAEQDLPADLRSGRYSNDDPDGPALRRAERIGYYNGKDLELSEIDELPPLSSGFLVNKEELYVYFKIDPKYVPLVKLILTVEELSADGKTVVPGHSQEFTIDPTSPAKFDPVTGELKLVLDSLNDPEFQFKTRCPKITPGSDIKVTAQLVPSSADGKDWIAPEPIWDTDNSLFGERNPSEEREMAYIAYPRHLQNLDSEYSGVTGTLAAEQTGPITWPTDIDFQSITNDGLRSYDGAKNEIKNLHGENGLFATFKGTSLSDIRIVDPRIDGSTIHIGALAGWIPVDPVVGPGGAWVPSLTISGCQVYASGDTAYDKIGVIGSAGSTGGLIGTAQWCTITNSFAGLPSLHGEAGFIGGLIGDATNCSISNCYAVVDELTAEGGTTGMFIGQAGGSIDSCYAVGNISKGSNLAGFASGNASISNSYCAVTYDKPDGTKNQPAYGFAPSAGENCYYLGAKAAGGGKALLYADMSGGKMNLPGQQWAYFGDKQALSLSHPYRPELFNKAYPFPALKYDNAPLPHYGSWPVQTIDTILAFRDKATPAPGQAEQTVDYLICPTGGSISFWAEPRNNGQPVDIRVDDPKFFFSFPDGTDTNDLTAALGSAESDSPRTQIVLHGNTPGVYAVEVSAGGARLWVPVIVCSAEMTLTGKYNDDLNVSNTATLNGQPNSAVLPLRTGMQATFSATLTVDLTCNKVNEGMAALYQAAGSGIPISSGNAQLTFEEKDWLGFRVVRDGKAEKYGPGITLNERVTDGVYQLKADDSGDHLYHVMGGGTINSAEQSTSDTLTVTGQSAGMATVSVCWAMDSRLTVNGHVQVSGTRAFILSASADGKISGPLGTRDNYPYLLDVRPAPKEDVTLSFTGWLSSPAPADATQTWKWSVKNVNTGEEKGTLEKTFSPNELSFGALPSYMFEVALNEKVARARYEVRLEYSYTAADSSYTTSDFMYVTVSRTTVNKETENNIVLTLKDDIVLEQINWGEQVKRPAGVTGDLNKATISGHVDGAADSRLLWYLGTGENKEQITGPMTALDNGIPIASLDWTMLSNGDSGVIIEALDSDYYGNTPLTFTLLAAAQDNDDAPEAKAVQVFIMPKLLLTPQSSVVLAKRVDQVTFTANRTPSIGTAYDYFWAKNNVGIAGTQKSQSVSIKADLINNATTKYEIGLIYGPYRAEAQLIVKPWAKDLNTAINWDGEIQESEDVTCGYILLQKGEPRKLVYSWCGRNGNTKYGIAQNGHPTSTNIIEISKATNATQLVESGSFEYTVTGKAFGRETLMWAMTNTNGKNPEYPYHYIYVVGTEFTRNNKPITDEIVITGQTGTAQVDLSGYFPAAVGTGTLTVTSDRPQVASFKTATEGGATQIADSLSFSPGETGIDQAITIQAHKYGTTLITATYKIGDREYSDTFSLRVEPPEGALHVKLEVCGDSNNLEKLFGEPNEHLAAYADYGDAQTPNFIPTLLSEPVFGMDTLYLKARLTDGNKVLDPAGYIHEIVATVDNARVAAIETPKDDMGNPKLVNNTLYIKLTSHNGSLIGDEVTVTAHFGTLSAKQPVRVFSEPSVVIRDETGAVVTNGHTVIKGFNPDPETGKMTYCFHAELYPWLQKCTVEDDGSITYTPLDGLVWFPEFPSDKYQADAFLTLDPPHPERPGMAVGPTRTVTIKASPGCKVAVNVQSKLAHAANSELSKSAHALVFLPELHKNDPEP